MQEFIATFHIDWKLMIAQAINFAIVFALFYWLASKPLSKLVKDRTEEIESGLINAKTNASILEKTKKEYDEVLAKARKEANDIFQTGKKEAELKKSEMMDQARAEMTAMMEQGRKTMKAEKVKMIAEAKHEVAGLIVQATEKLLGEKVDAGYEARAVKELNNL